MQRRLNSVERNYEIRASVGAVSSLHDQRMGLLHPVDLSSQISQGHFAVRCSKSINLLISKQYEYS